MAIDTLIVCKAHDCYWNMDEECISKQILLIQANRLKPPECQTYIYWKEAKRRLAIATNKEEVSHG